MTCGRPPIDGGGDVSEPGHGPGSLIAAHGSRNASGARTGSASRPPFWVRCPRGLRLRPGGDRLRPCRGEGGRSGGLLRQARRRRRARPRPRRRRGAHRHLAVEDAARDRALPLRPSSGRALRRQGLARQGARGAAPHVEQGPRGRAPRSTGSTGTSIATTSTTSTARPRSTDPHTVDDHDRGRGRAAAAHRRVHPRRHRVHAPPPARDPLRRPGHRRQRQHPAHGPPARVAGASSAPASSAASTRPCSRRSAPR